MDDTDLYCKIYIDSDQSKVELLRLIASWLNAKVETHKYLNIIRLDDRRLDITNNEDFNNQLKDDPIEGFVYFKYYIDVDGPQPLEREETELYTEQISFVSSLLEHFWAEGIPAIAACDFEDELPYNGGYNTEVKPWQKAAVSQAR